MQNATLNEAQAVRKIAGRNINNLRCADDATLHRKKRGTEEPKIWFKIQHSKK